MKSFGPLAFTYVDVGGRDGLSPPWSHVADRIGVIGFEPDPEECARLNASARPGHRFVNAALSDAPGEVSLFLARSRGASSLFRPDFSILRNFPESARFETEQTVRVQSTTLDLLATQGALPPVDFLKVDVQGSELHVLRGGTSVLKKELIGLECEVEFLPIYEEQPLFADVDTWVRTQLGFQLMDLRRSYWRRRCARPDLGAQKGQLVFGDALYFRTPESVISLGQQRKIDAALLAAVVYGYLDYAQSLLELWEQAPSYDRARHDQWMGILRRLGKNPRPFKWGEARLAAAFQSLHRLFEASHSGWSTSDHALGSRKRFWWFE